MYDVYGETCLVKKMLTDDLNIDFPRRTGIKKQSMEWKQFWALCSIKKVKLTVFLDMKRPISYDFLEKSLTVNKPSCCQHLW